MMRRVFQRTRSGAIEALLSPAEADAVARAARDMAEALEAAADDESMVRLFPPAYADEPEREKAFHAMTHDDLVASKIGAARAVVASIEEGTRKRNAWRAELDDATAHAWLGFFNDARLVLGTRLNVTEETDHEPRPPSDPDAPAHNLYIYLSALEGLLIEELLLGLPEGEEG